MDTVYIETSVISRASAWRSSEPVMAVLQEQAARWFSEEAPKYNLVVSQFVVNEVSRGDPNAASRRLALIADIPQLLPDVRVEEIADEILKRALMPATARLDALHVAAAALGGVQYLLTQNCRHIANAHVLPQVYKLLDELDLPRLLICTPAEFLGGSYDETGPYT